MRISDWSSDVCSSDLGIDSIGGYEKQYLVQPDPARLASYGISFTELAAALERNNVAVGANYINRGGEAFLARVDPRITGIDQIGNAVVANREGVPVRVQIGRANVCTPVTHAHPVC